MRAREAGTWTDPEGFSTDSECWEGDRLVTLTDSEGWEGAEGQ